MFSNLRVAATAAAMILFVSSPCWAGNLEVVALEGGSLVHYWAEPGKAWNRAGVITTKATGPGAIIQDLVGNLQVVVVEGDSLVHYEFVSGKGWSRVDVITTKATGPGSITVNAAGNLEVVVLQSDGLVAYVAEPGKAWNRAGVVSTKATGPGAIIQNKSGILEVLVREGDNLVQYRAAPGKDWNRGEVISRKATGPGALIQNHQKEDNLEAVVQEGNELVHYWWDMWKETWNRGGVITAKASGPGALTQSEGTGNLEAVVPEGESLVHYWLGAGSPWSRGAAITTKATGPGSIVTRTPTLAEELRAARKAYFDYVEARKAGNQKKADDSYNIMLACLNRCATGLPNVTPEVGKPKTYLKVAMNSQKADFDAIRLHMPVGGRFDMEWEYVYPKSISDVSWFIYGRSPRHWIRKGFVTYDRSENYQEEGADLPKENKRVVQPLADGQLYGRMDYIIWFAFDRNTPPTDFYIRAGLTPIKE